MAATATGSTPLMSSGEHSGITSPSPSSSPQSTAASSGSTRTATSQCFDIRGCGTPRDSAERDIVPKIEVVDDQELIVRSLPSPKEEEPPEHHAEQTLVKRPRGRPRKHVKDPPFSISKSAKGRSKTGCITCRRRKKKCDETKPACLHCQKNNVHCEGYPPRDYWQSGKQRACNGRGFNEDKPRDLPSLIDGIENDLDWLFFDHFNLHVSRVLSMFSEEYNPWTQILLPMATGHRGLMHAVLCLAGSHLVAREHDDALQERSYHHFAQAISHLRADESMTASVNGDATALIDDPTIASTLLLCLRSISSGDLDGSYRPHLSAARHLVMTQKASNPEFQSFLIEFFIYHDVCNSITRLDHSSVLMTDDFDLPELMVQPEAAAFLGVTDGLFSSISDIKKLRNRIRGRQAASTMPFADFEVFGSARKIDEDLRNWTCTQHKASSRWLASMLYRQVTWLYLYRTVMPSKPNDRLKEALETGLSYLRELPTDSSTQSMMLMPLFLLGCSAFWEEHRPEIGTAFDELQAYSHLGNIKYARQIVEKVWQLMDAGDPMSWDWEEIIEQQGWDFLIT